ncbi:MAG TPA: amino acid adenylation domain-containing protein, partial [Bacteroidia bacterium]|nr:amino acid adenylation domain-containing protein [Bacteroidia bacterium]
RIAIIDKEQQFTYGEIARKANSIGQVLRNKKVVPNELVAILMKKGWQEVPACLGIMKSGAAYLPLDITMPFSRLEFILQKANVTHAIATKEVMEEGIQVPEGVQILILESIQDEYPDAILEPVQKTSDLAYVIFTSGSTGFPKGVMIDHRGALNTCADINKRFHVQSSDAVLALSSLYFDLSVYDLFGMLSAGGKIVYPDASRLKDPKHWIQLIEKHRVTIWNAVPELMNMLIEYNALIERKTFKELRLVMMSGDWIPVTLPQKIKQAMIGAEVISLGGATEGSIWSIFHKIEQINPGLKSIPYGKALKNQTMHVLNQHLEPCPFLTTGDIYIGGIGVAKGYLKDDEKTSKQFIRHPRTNEIIYKTGDLGRVLRNGDIEFLGREDFQVKVQGYRIELGEIEAIMLRSGLAKAAVVDVKKDVVGNNYLVGYVVPQKEENEDAIKNYLLKNLQAYMVPKDLLFLSELPITQNGKIDRKNLPEPRKKKDSSKAPAASATQHEATVKTIWRELLDTEEVKPENNFFESGGNSLLAIRLVAHLDSRLNVKIELSDLLRHSTFANLMELIAEKNTVVKQERPSIVCIKNEGGELPPLFLVHPIGGSVFCYNQLAKELDEDQPVYGFYAKGTEEGFPALNDVKAMAAKYIHGMKTVQKNGPYKLGG